MIQITLTMALAIYSMLLFALFFFIWAYTEIATRVEHRRLAKQYLWRCAFCGFCYLDDGSERVSQCPRCGSYSSVDDRFVKEVRPRRVQTAPAPLEPRTHRNTSHRKRPHQRRRGPRRR